MSKQKKNGKLSRRDRHNADQSKGGRQYVPTVYVDPPNKGVAAQPVMAAKPLATATRLKGYVTKVMPEGTFGFIRSDAGDVYVKFRTLLSDDLQDLFTLGAILDCDVEPNSQGSARYRAVRVHTIEAPAVPVVSVPQKGPHKEVDPATVRRMTITVIFSRRSHSFAKGQTADGVEVYIPNKFVMERPLLGAIHEGALIDCEVGDNPQRAGQLRVTRVHDLMPVGALPPAEKVIKRIPITVGA